MHPAWASRSLGFVQREGSNFDSDTLPRMRIWQVTHYGEPEEMLLGEVDPPSPGEGEVLIRNRACGLNFFDLLQCRGKYQSKPAFPFTIGAEVSGTLAAVGANVRGFAAGQRVLALPRGGGFAEYTLARASRVFPIPESMDFDQGAAMRWSFRLHCSPWSTEPGCAPGNGCSCMPGPAASARQRFNSESRWAPK